MKKYGCIPVRAVINLGRGPLHYKRENNMKYLPLLLLLLACNPETEAIEAVVVELPEQNDRSEFELRPVQYPRALYCVHEDYMPGNPALGDTVIAPAKTKFMDAVRAYYEANGFVEQ